MPDQAVLQDSLLGVEFGHYRILERIGSGGMGVVYRGYDSHLDREVAIKLLTPGTVVDDHSHRRFLNEAHALSKLNHPNIATVFDFHTQNGRDFLVMEYIEGITLNQKLLDGSLPEKDVVALGTQLAEGLSAAHYHSIIHRDLKPGNVRLTTDGRLKILDFGLAKLRFPSQASAASETISETRVIAGTLAYMAPEQVLGGEIDARTDIHAAGTVLYHMSTGTPPFNSLDRSELMNEVLRSSPTPANQLNPRLSVELARIIAKCLERDPEDRYQSAKELAIDLRRLHSCVTSNAQRMPQIPLWKSANFLLLSLMLGGSVVALFTIFGIANWSGRVFVGANPPHIKSLAVLPLTNLSGDPQQEYFADGMTEELITNLGKVAALRVISRTSIMQYKQTRKTLPQIARELNVDAVVEGSVLRSGDSVRITAQLIQAKDDRHLWSESYERNVSDILALQSEVAHAITSGIKANVTPQEQSRLADSRQVNPEAYEAFLQGRYYWNKRNREGVLQGLEYFQKAIRLDPTYALAYVGVADSYIILLVFHWLPPSAAIPPAREATLKALSIDETLAEAHNAMAMIRKSDWEWTTAEKEFRRALEINPNYATAHLWYSVFLSEMGRHEEAMDEAERAAEIDPRSLISNAMVGQSLYLARHYGEALHTLSKVIEIDPQFEPAQYCAGQVYLQTGRFDEGIAALNHAAALSPGDDVVFSALVYANGRAGRKAAAEKVLAEWKEVSRERHVSGYLLAESYVGLGETELAMQSLERAYQERDIMLITMGVDPMLDPLRVDPRLQDLLRRMNLSRSVPSP